MSADDRWLRARTPIDLACNVFAYFHLLNIYSCFQTFVFSYAHRHRFQRANLFKMVSYVRVTVLLWADSFAAYAIWTLMTYLTDVWKLNLTHAAAIINVFMGTSFVLPLFTSFIVDSFMGDYDMLLLSGLASCFGLSFLAMSTPPFLSQSAGNCSAYKPECIGTTQKALFYTALPLICIGIAGRVTSLLTFLSAQLEVAEEEIEEGNTRANCKFLGFIFGTIFIPVIGGIALPYIKPWSFRFGIPAICMIVATFLFLSASGSYIREKPLGHPLMTILRVVVASASKIFHPTPDIGKLYEVPGLEFNYGNHVGHTSSLRWLDKAAIISPNTTLEQQEKNRWRLCSLKEVEETKTVIRTIPMLMTFLMCGVISSIGNTYFLEQASHMNPKLGRWEVPLPIFLIFYEMAKWVAGSLYGRIRITKKYSPTAGFLMAMTASILCCIAAAKVEERRLQVVMRHVLLDKPDERVPMSMFWLLPQFLLLGAFDQLFLDSFNTYFDDQLPASIMCFLPDLAVAVYGVGYIGSVPSVYLVSKVSGSGHKSAGWFRQTLNKSRLDKYYLILAAMSVVNMVLYVLVSPLYKYWNSQEDDKDDEV